MAKRITDLQVINEVTDDDQLVVIDVDDTSAGPLGTDKRVTLGAVGQLLEPYVEASTEQADRAESEADRSAAEADAVRQELSDPAQGGWLVQVTTSSGEQALIEALDNRAVYQPSVAAMEALDSGDLTAGQLFNVRGTIFRWDGANFVPEGEVSVQAYGAAGDGATDDTVAIQAALDSGASVVTGAGGSFRVDSTLTIPADVTLKDCHIDFSSAALGDTLFEAAGSEASFSITSSVFAGDTVVPVSDGTQFAVDDFVMVRSDKLWESLTSSTMSEMSRIRSISGNNLTLYSPLLYTYGTGDSAACVRLDLAEGIALKNVSAKGGGAGLEHRGTLFSRCLDLTIDDCNFEDFEIASIRIERSARFLVRGTKSSRNAATGTGYGVTIFNGSQWGTIEGCYFDDCRHGVTIGGIQGVNRYITVHGCHAYGCRDSGLDSHPAGDYIIFDANHSEQIGGQDGLVMQGANGIISNNTVVGATRHGIFAQMAMSASQPSVSITGNIVSHPTGSGTVAIYLLQQGSIGIADSVISDNLIKSEWVNSIRVTATSSNINRITVNGNACNRPSGPGILFTTSTGSQIWFGSIAGNTIRGFAEQIYLNASASPDIQYISVVGNACQGGTYGIRGNNTNRIATSANVVTGASVSTISVDGAQSVASGNVTA